MAEVGQKRGRDQLEAVRDGKTNKVIEYRVKKAKGDGQQVVVAETKSGALIKSTVNRTSGLMAPTMCLTGHDDAVYSVKFNGDGTRVASAGKDKNVFLWNVYGDCQNFRVLKGHSSAILEVNWSRDGDQVYTASADRTGSVFDVETGERIKRLKGHDSFVNSVCSTRRGVPFVATVSDDCYALLWDMRIQRATSELKHEYQVLSSTFSDDGSQLFTAGIENVVHCWDLRKDEEPIYTMKGHKDTITGISLSPDGKYLLSNSMDNTVRTWDVRPYVSNTRALSVYQGHRHDFQQLMLRCSWSNDGTKISAGSADRFVYVWDVATRAVAYKLPGHLSAVTEVAFHPKEPVIASCGADKQVFLGELQF